MKLAPARRADRILMMLLVLADLVTIPLVFAFTWFLRTVVLVDILPDFHHEITLYLVALPVLTFIWLFSFARSGLYVPRRHPGGMAEIQRLLKAFATLLVSLMAASYLVRVEYSRLMLFLFIGTAFPASVLARILARRLAQASAPVSEAPRILVVGTGEVASRVVSSLRRLPGRAPEIAGVVAVGNSDADMLLGVPIVSGLDGLEQTIERMDIDEVFFASPQLNHSTVMALISSMDRSDVHYRLVTDLFEIAMGITDLDDMARLPIVEIGQGSPGTLHRMMKRSMDVVLSFCLIVLMLPVMAVIYLVHLISRNGSPVFRQRRVGLRGREFTLYKFRTMKPDSDEYEVAPVSIGDNRITRLGRLLRRTSMDELPQLFNVLKGDMSMVGPRPEMPFIVDDYNGWQRHRLEVKPGLTGLWQIMGRKELPLHDNLEYDYYYIRNQSLMLDFTILLRTVAVIFKGRGAY
ncbi:MAG: hypothetical protein AVO35_10230 [Candidatus Aegiribacteria sp. MLS_C]|nr:MAG: hypothetical protein AVO35_10230 [Candidatus Aegiribacteria sp. MLS_C]